MRSVFYNDMHVNTYNRQFMLICGIFRRLKYKAPFSKKKMMVEWICIEQCCWTLYKIFSLKHFYCDIVSTNTRLEVYFYVNIYIMYILLILFYVWVSHLCITKQCLVILHVLSMLYYWNHIWMTNIFHISMCGSFLF